VPEEVEEEEEDDEDATWEKLLDLTYKIVFKNIDSVGI